jgi:hypothetical protein
MGVPSPSGFGLHECGGIAKLKEGVAGLLAARSDHDLRCLKDEMRLLKARTSQSETLEGGGRHS